MMARHSPTPSNVLVVDAKTNLPTPSEIPTRTASKNFRIYSPRFFPFTSMNTVLRDLDLEEEEISLTGPSYSPITKPVSNSRETL